MVSIYRNYNEIEQALQEFSEAAQYAVDNLDRLNEHYLEITVFWKYQVSPIILGEADPSLLTPFRIANHKKGVMKDRPPTAFRRKDGELRYGEFGFGKDGKLLYMDVITQYANGSRRTSRHYVVFDLKGYRYYIFAERGGMLAWAWLYRTKHDNGRIVLCEIADLGFNRASLKGEYYFYDRVNAGMIDCLTLDYHAKNNTTVGNAQADMLGSFGVEPLESAVNSLLDGVGLDPEKPIAKINRWKMHSDSSGRIISANHIGEVNETFQCESD